MTLRKERPKSRKINRWTAEQDQIMLIAIYASKAQVDWKYVANCVGNDVTDAAVIQHIAKLRKRLAANKVEVPDLGRPAKVMSRSASKPTPKRRSASTFEPYQGGSDDDYSPSGVQRPKRRVKAPARIKDVIKDDEVYSESERSIKADGSDGSDWSASEGGGKGNNTSGSKKSSSVAKLVAYRSTPMPRVKTEVDYVEQNISPSNPEGKSLVVRLGIHATIEEDESKADMEMESDEEELAVQETENHTQLTADTASMSSDIIYDTHQDTSPGIEFGSAAENPWNEEQVSSGQHEFEETMNAGHPMDHQGAYVPHLHAHILDPHGFLGLNQNVSSVASGFNALRHLPANNQLPVGYSIPTLDQYESHFEQEIGDDLDRFDQDQEDEMPEIDDDDDVFMALWDDQIEP